MLTDRFEPFTLLQECREPDGLGGSHRAVKTVLGFRGLLTHTAGVVHEVGDQPLPRATPALLHEFDVTLSPGELVLRQRDGAIYRVTGRTEDMRSPAFSGLQFAQVPVERVVTPC